MVRNPHHKFLKQSLCTVNDRTPPLGVGVSAHIKVHYQFCTMFMKTHQEILYLEEIFQNVHLRFLDALDHLSNYPAPVDDTTLRTPTSQDHLKRSVLSG